MIVAEGAQDLHLNKITSNAVQDVLSNRLKLDTRVTVLGHTQRGGAACAYDRTLATLQGIEAVKAVLDASPTSPSPLITIRENKIERSSLVEAVKLTKSVAASIQNKDFDAAMGLRDAEFKDYHRSYINVTTPYHLKLQLPEEKVFLHYIAHIYLVLSCLLT